LGTKFYLKKTQIVPANGGSLTMAMIGSPRFLNPILSQLNNPDRDLTPLFFSALMKYDSQGKLIGDLAENYSISDDGKTYDLTLKKNIKWQDGKPLTIDDVIFTLQTIQNSEYKSPLWALWQGADFEKVDDQTIRFNLKSPYAPFLYTLTFGILPKHLWQNVSPSQFPLTEFNLKPIGSGPYQFSKFVKDSNGNIKSLEIKAYNQYFLGGPHISKITIQFYDTEEAALSAYKRGEVNAFNSISPKTKQDLQSKNSEIAIYSIRLPRYFAVFFNQTQNPVLADKNVRQALAFATDKETIIKDVLNGEGTAVDSPILQGMTGFNEQVKKYDFNIDQAKAILEGAGWKDSDNDGILDKNNQKLEITLTTNDRPDLIQTAQLLQTQWQQIAIKVNLDIQDSARIQNEIIRPRQFQALLFGEVLGLEPDPFSFWHSSQKKDPGLNLALYENPEADKLLIDARQDMDTNDRAQKYQQFCNLVAEDLPAIFLYNPDYLLAISNKVQGVEFKNLNNISSYFDQINNWFINTKRAWR